MEAQNCFVRRFDRFVVLTEEDKRYWGELNNIEVIPNAITYIPSEKSNLENKKVVAVGRYSFQKGFDRLIEAWRIVVKDFPDWKLDIVGDGEEYEKLKKLISGYGLDNSVALIKTKKNIGDVYRNASVYAMTSRYEGLPMVLLEAQSYGLPVVSFDCKCGPKDIIDEGENGFIVADGNISLFAVRMAELMKDMSLRKRMGEKAGISILKYDEATVMGKWIQTFKSISYR